MASALISIKQVRGRSEPMVNAIIQFLIFLIQYIAEKVLDLFSGHYIIGRFSAFSVGDKRKEIWKAGKEWYLENRKVGARFHSLNIVDDILPSGVMKVQDNERVFPFYAESLNGKGIQFKSFSQYLEKENGHSKHILLIGEGGIGKTTTLISVMKNVYESKYNKSGLIPLFIELSLAPDTKECPAYDGESSTVVFRLIYALIKRNSYVGEYGDLVRACLYDTSNIAKEEVLKTLGDKQHSKQYILLIDGVNEIPVNDLDNRGVSVHTRVLLELKSIKSLLPEISIVLTSRENIPILASSFDVYYLKPLNNEQITSYLKENKKSEDEIIQLFEKENSLVEVLRIPLFLTMFVTLKSSKGISTRGELLKIFFHERRINYGVYNQGKRLKDIEDNRLKNSLARFTRSNKINIFQQELFLDVLLPEIAAKMDFNHSYRVSKEDIKDALKEVLLSENSFYRKGFMDDLFRPLYCNRSIRGMIHELLSIYDKGLGENEIIEELTEDFLICCERALGILYGESGKDIAFIHQYLRDYFAAIWHINNMKASYLVFQKEKNQSKALRIMSAEEKRVIDPVVQILIGEYLGEHHNSQCINNENYVQVQPNYIPETQLVNSLLDVFRNIKEKDSYGVYNLIEIMKKSRTTLNGIDFHNLDLRLCSFQGIHFDNTLPSKTSFNGALINADYWIYSGHSSAVTNISINREGNLCITASIDGTARIWNILTGTLVQNIEEKNGPITCVDFNYESSLVIIAYKTGHFSIWDIDSGRLCYSIKGHDSEITCVDVSNKNNLLLTGDIQGNLLVWDVQSGILLNKLIGHSDSISSAKFNVDGNMIVSASEDGSAQIWNTQSGSSVVTITLDKYPVRYVSFNSSGSEFALASSNGRAYTFNAHSGVLHHTFKGHTAAVESVEFSIDGTRIITASKDKTACIWDTLSGCLLYRLNNHLDSVNIALFNKKGDLAVTASNDGTIKVWSAYSGELIRSLTRHIGAVKNIKTNEEGNILASISRDGTARLWEVYSGTQLHSLEVHSNWVNTVEFNKNNNLLVTAASDGVARIWDVSLKKVICSLEGHQDWINSARFSKDSKYIITASSDKTVKIWDVATGTVQYSISGHSDWIHSADFNCDGTKIVTASYDGIAIIWDIETQKKLSVLTGHSDWINSAVFSNDGERIVTSSSDGTIRVWDVLTGRELFIIEGHTNWVRYATFSSDDSLIISASYDYTACIWDAKNGALIRLFKDQLSWMLSADISNDNHFLVTGSYDGIARVWNVLTGEIIARLEGHLSEIRSVVFSHDGNKIATASRDGTIRIWDMNGKCETVLYESYGLYISGVDLRNIHRESVMSEDHKEIFRQYGAITD